MIYLLILVLVVINILLLIKVQHENLKFLDFINKVDLELAKAIKDTEDWDKSRFASRTVLLNLQKELSDD
jgi:hypothetical protein